MFPEHEQRQNSTRPTKQGPVSRHKQEPTDKLPNADWLEAGFGLGSAGFGWVRLGSAGFGWVWAEFGLDRAQPALLPLSAPESGANSRPRKRLHRTV